MTQPLRKTRGVTVLALTECKPRDCARVVRIIRDMVPTLEALRGFVSVSLHVSKKKDRVVQRIEWKSAAAYAASQEAEHWATKDAAAFWKLMENGTVKMDAQVYKAVLDRPA